MLNDHQIIAADRPIASVFEDSLRRDGFADALAMAIQGWKEPDSLVIGIYGPWGSGKSSLKNLVISNLQEQCGAGVPVLQFHPWQWSGHTPLSTAFFRELQVVLRQSGIKDAAQISAKLREYADLLKLGKDAFGDLSGWLKQVLSTLENMTTLASKLIGSRVAGMDQAKAELAALLGKVEQPILVIVDDIDRLAPNEVREVIQLIKANGDFPNLVYLLLFQRDLVERAIGISFSADEAYGRQFLEKIVHIGFNMPTIAEREMKDVFQSMVGQAFSLHRQTMQVSSQRFQELWEGAFLEHLPTLRAVKRYASTVSFVLPTFIKRDQLTCDAIDLLGLELVRFAEPELFEMLAQCNAYLVQQPGGLDYSSGPALWAHQRLERYFASNELRRSMRELVVDIFPSCLQFGKIPGYRTPAWNEPRTIPRNRACHPDGFDQYFQLVLTDR